MNKPSPDKLFKAFADPTRLRILSLLSNGEVCVCDLMEALKLPQPTISRHLSYLRRNEMVETRRDSQWIYYSLPKNITRFQKKLIDCLDCCFDDTPTFKNDKKALKSLSRKSATCC